VKKMFGRKKNNEPEQPWPSDETVNSEQPAAEEIKA
jgi:hypothetical protein